MPWTPRRSTTGWCSPRWPVTVSRTGEETDSSGTGIIATSDGYIITNAHVVLNTKSVLVTVTTYDGQQYDAVVVGMDRTTDLAIIKTNDYGFTPAQFGDSDQLSIGEWVVAIGNPGGERFASSLTRGIISGLDRAVERYSEDGMTFIQTDAAINPGNSGGPLVNMYGQVVGINSSKIITDGYEGMGFAIPVSKAKDIIDQLLSGGYVEGRVRLGITGSDISATQAAFYGVPRGFMIVSIDEDSAFAGTEAQPEDIITAIDGETVEELQDISNLLLRYSPGDEITVTLYRLPGKQPAGRGRAGSDHHPAGGQGGDPEVMAKEKVEKTNALRLLDRMKIPYEAHAYPCQEFSGGEDVARQLGLDPADVCKTLVTVGKSGGHYVFVLPVSGELDREKGGGPGRGRSPWRCSMSRTCWPSPGTSGAGARPWG